MALLGLVFLLAAFSTSGVSATPSPVVPEDLYKLTFLNAALISPDGTHVLVSSAKLNGPKNTYDRTISLVDVATGAVHPNITGMTGDGDYDWMPDGKSFVFVRTLPKQKPQLYRFSLQTGTPVKLTSIAQGVSGPVVSHDGTRIALTVTDKDAVEAAYIDFGKAGFTPTAAQKKTDIRKIDDLFFETNGEGYTYADHAHLWTVNADGTSPKQITSGRWSENLIGWSPDDKTLAFGSLQYETPDSGRVDAYIVSSQGGTPQKVASAEASDNGLFFTGDGTRMIFARGGVTDSAELASIVSAKLDGSDPRVVVPKNTVAFGDSLLADMKEGGGLCDAPMPDGTHALFNADGPGYANLRMLDLTTGAFANVTPQRGEAWSCSVSRDGKTIAYLYSDFLHPADVYVTQPSGGTPRRLTGVNDAYLASVKLSVPQPLAVRDASGNEVQTWFMPAVGLRPGQKAPTLLDIHGGPETQFGDTFFMEFQYYASLGYNVVFSDPAGSTGHGYAFEEALESDYGDAMFRDVQAAMDVAVQRPEVDAAKLGVLGGSYGGYATLWVISHTDRYKVAVAERVVSSLQSENLAADFAGKNGLGGGYYNWGAPWDPASADYAKFSPLTYVANVRTPLMILHSDLDTRTPIDQTLQEFTALKILGRTVQYVDVPNETHDLSRTGSPLHRVERMHLIADWLNRYIKP
jgi:dipeptidyl aminopeptidase/acylaminoacyl peptidase